MGACGVSLLGLMLQWLWRTRRPSSSRRSSDPAGCVPARLPPSPHTSCKIGGVWAATLTARRVVVLQVMRWPDMRMNLIASRIWDMNDMEVEIAAQRTKVEEAGLAAR